MQQCSKRFQKPYKVAGIKTFKVFVVKYRWLHKNINTSDIAESVKTFLQQQGFRTTSSESKEQKKIVGMIRDAEGVKRVIIAITGKPDDFMVDLHAGEAAQLIEKFASMITFFGGGALELKSLKEKEFYQKLEDEFWKYLEDFVAGQSRH